MGIIVDVEILKRLENMKGKLRGNHRVIAQYITENPEKVGYLTATALSNALGISPSTTVRFVQQLGFKGFPEFKRQFLKEIGFATPYSLMSDYVGTLSKEKGKWIAEVFEKEIENMKRTLTNIDMKSFNRIIGLIESAPRTVVAAVSIAKALADRLTMALHAVKVPAYSVVASELYLFRETLIGSKDDLYIIIGLEKVPKEVIKIVDLLKQQGLKVVAITDDKNFKLAQSADYVIPVSSERIGCFYSVAPFNALFTAIGIGLAARTKGKTVESMEEMDKVWKRLV